MNRIILIGSLAILAWTATFLVAADRGYSSKLLVLNSADPVYLNRAIRLGDDSTLRESCFDIRLRPSAVAQALRRELPNAIERRGADGFQMVIPREDHGRIRVAEYPRVSILVREGALNIAPSKAESKAWSHIILREHQDPNVIESVWRWLGEQFKV